MGRFDTWRLWTDQSYFQVVIQELEGEKPASRSAAVADEVPRHPKQSDGPEEASEEVVEA